ncbi:MAG: GTPase HflX, partial [Myxococcales bacterium]|nr:GTPase HflX [Myxococcales bacterium]
MDQTTSGTSGTVKCSTTCATNPARLRISAKIEGHTEGLKSSHLKSLEKLFGKVRTSGITTHQHAARICQISYEIGRTVGVLIDRGGNVTHVIVGDASRLYLPDIGRQRAGTTRLRGLRLVRTQTGDAHLSREDLTDLAKLRLDLVAVVAVGAGGYPTKASWAHLKPTEAGETPQSEVISGRPVAELEEFQLLEVLEALESEMRRTTAVLKTTGAVPGILVYVKTKGDWQADDRIAELHELARTAGLEILETVTQQRYQMHPRTVVGSDKLEEIELLCLDLGAEMVVFGHDLNPGQARHIAERTELKVIDRTQLILDIFAQHAKSKDGKLQVELAQLRYNMPRLVARNTAMSRLTGGIGGRGPGETKLEINRRRARDRVTKLESELSKRAEIRERQRQRRNDRDVPVVSIVGYTNAGKSTLLNALTNADVIAENKLFATLDPTTRRLRFPEHRELVLTDTVGFIHDLPQELASAFKATLEELDEADLLVHVVDLSAENFEQKMADVQRILDQLELKDKPTLLVFNKV